MFCFGPTKYLILYFAVRSSAPDKHGPSEIALNISHQITVQNCYYHLPNHLNL